jgi:Protein of unknown function (DUF3365)
MNDINRVRLITTLLCILVSFPALSETTTDVDPRVGQSRMAVKAFGSELVGKLKHALGNGGPVTAINVCNIEAPKIATGLSEKYDWSIGRTAIKTRNPNNKPDAWEQAVLQQFEQRKQQGEAIATLEYSEETDKGFRYMKAIPTKGLCLTCHGETLSESVKATLAKRYPDDTATGFNVGDIRGAFTIIQKN